MEAYLPLSELIDKDEELARINKETLTTELNNPAAVPTPYWPPNKP